MIRTVTVEKTRQLCRGFDGDIGFVPTMGALHNGHLGLVETAARDNDHVVVSIFVNPLQFGSDEDLDSYPRHLERDLKLCEELGVTAVWTPTVEDLYPTGSETTVSVEGLGSRFEGRSRPEHFKGVTTVVTKLFNVVNPNRAYFGRKDLQQLFVIKQMVRDLLIPVTVVPVETVRDGNGLALSSRNGYLSGEDRTRAAAIYEGLVGVQQAHARGQNQWEFLESVFRESVAGLEGASVERFDLLRSDLSGAYEKGESVEQGYCSVAVCYRGVRLIDNIELCC